MLLSLDANYPEYIDRILFENNLNRDSYNRFVKTRDLFLVDYNHIGDDSILCNEKYFKEKLENLIRFNKSVDGVASPDVVRNAFTEIEDIYSDSFEIRFKNSNDASYEGMVVFRKKFDPKELRDILDMVVHGCKRCKMEVYEHSIMRDRLYSFRLGPIGIYNKKYGIKG